MAKRKPTAQRRWQPMERAVFSISKEKEAFIRELAAQADLEFDDLVGPEVWMNDRYTVIVRRSDEEAVTQLSIRRNDRKAVHDWREFQRIKNEIAGEEIEALELYPAESRLVDSANQYWLYCLPPGEQAPFGFTHRVVTDADDEITAAFGAVQRPL